MRRISWMLAMVLVLSTLLAACGKKDAAAVVKDLNEVVGEMESYQGAGVMTLHTGDTPQQYKVEVWHQKPSYYRIALTNAKKDVTQIVLRNDEGVFVLTPSQNKSFRFQSNWPDNQGQVYLYETLIRSITGDSTRQFADEKESYVFDVAANYNTHALVRQKIWLNKSDYAPKQVEVSDSNANVVVDVKFDSFKFGTEFEKDAFDMQRNMTAATENGGKVGTDSGAAPAGEGKETTNPQAATEEGSASNPSGTVSDGQTGVSDNAEQQGSEDPASGKGTEEPTSAEPEGTGSFGVIQPTYAPEGVKLKDDQIVEGSGDYSVMLRYEGTYNYTIFEARPQDRAVSLAPSSVVDLGFTLGMLSGDALQTLTWMTDGVEYRITSADLPQNEMVQIATSMQEESGK
ncbi:Outer membrane lipoprotein-sorting protein [Paenibacillus sp. ov031]|uniref:outer membrane lipoprotein-sorting protein n=1 Tax=unclassified Paenibacillus TaxID=185978 RepID=UPI000897B872|nr:MULTISPECIES: outer membrane lipoprotein-sorting protein [unclassified Paenibacillus]SEB07933.1 Outer membrane lipoprotein-sorting protein [Paenibacillus sp. 276b]SHN74001.1 Outer membrane lipoprotein-sorting protein [Paenibacillus sp. ov031]